LYAVGGRNTSYHEPNNFGAFFGTVIAEVDVYDFDTKRWRTLPHGLPTPTAAGGLVELGGDIYYFGGESSQSLAHDATQRLDVDAGTWTLLPPMQRGRHGSGAVVIDGKIYVAAGSGGRGGGPELSSTEVFTPGQ
jgi:N-acetylneuraminic acid mutarotase